MDYEGLNVKATPFGPYDAMFIEAVQSRWLSLLDERDFVGNQAGKVIVEFRLHHDGRITAHGAPNEGATIIVTLPLRQSTAEAAFNSALL